MDWMDSNYVVHGSHAADSCAHLSFLQAVSDEAEGLSQKLEMSSNIYGLCLRSFGRRGW